jgi:hypothetical protein
MFGHRSFLILGNNSPADIKSLTKGGYEIAHYNFSFQQGVDAKGKATTKVYGGKIHITLTQLPPDELLEWQLESRMRKEGVIVSLDYDNIPIEKVIFSNAICSELELDYMLKGESYCRTRIAIQAEKITIGNGTPLDNEWNED